MLLDWLSKRIIKGDNSQWLQKSLLMDWVKRNDSNKDILPQGCSRVIHKGTPSTSIHPVLFAIVQGG